MRISEEIKEALVAVAVFAWVLLAIWGGIVTMENIRLGARLNALETVCKANLLVTKENGK